MGVQLYGISVSLSDTVEMGYGLVRLPSIFGIWNQKRPSVSVVAAEFSNMDETAPPVLEDEDSAYGVALHDSS